MAPVYDLRPAPVSRCRVAVAEDDPAILELLQIHLETAGYDVELARNGVEAVELVKTSRPSVLVLDLNMPELDGFGVLAAVALLPPAHQPRVLMLTAQRRTSDVQRCVQLGAKDFLSKPFEHAELLSRVARLARGGGAAAPRLMAG